MGSTVSAARELPRDDRPFAQLVTNSSFTPTYFVRETTILLLARDVVIAGDSSEAENAVAWARDVVDTYENSPHDGDCTNQPQTCFRCLIDAANREAWSLHDDD